MCNDPRSPVVPHSEDYSLPYRWERPWMFALCRTCHFRLHVRFRRPNGWLAYKMHLKRGGYGFELKFPEISYEVRWAELMVSLGEVPKLQHLRRRKNTSRWWDALALSKLP